MFLLCIYDSDPLSLICLHHDTFTIYVVHLKYFAFKFSKTGKMISLRHLFTSRPVRTVYGATILQKNHVACML